MTATILPFPLARRRPMIARQVRYAAQLSPDAADRHIFCQLRLQEDSLKRKGVDPNLIRQELKMMEAAIRDMIARTRFHATEFPGCEKGPA